MSLSVCPIAVVESPAERIWALLAEPASYASWWDAKTDAIVPSGPAQPGQEISAHSRALGIDWPVHVHVIAVDASHREIKLVTSLPFGITIDNHIKVRLVDLQTSRVSFG